MTTTDTLRALPHEELVELVRRQITGAQSSSVVRNTHETAPAESSTYLMNPHVEPARIAAYPRRKSTARTLRNAPPVPPTSATNGEFRYEDFLAQKRAARSTRGNWEPTYADFFTPTSALTTHRALITA